MKQRLAIVILLTVAVGLVYGQTLRFDFVGADDPHYVVNNPNVRAGLTLANVPWAFHNTASANWHPLTWFSHMLDVEIFGTWAGGHHATNVLLHLANSLLLYWLLAAATERRGAALFSALVFALHPLHVESVAWISERKDVLSTLFWLLACLVYLDYGRTGRRRSYWVSVALMALGLMAKPMLVTLPFVFLLLDYWPLRRWPAAGAPGDAGSGRALLRLVGEKLPMLALSAASCVLTIVFQGRSQAMFLQEQIPLVARIANAFVSYVRYLDLTIRPRDLHLFYQHPYMDGGTPWDGWQVAGAALLLVLVTAVVVTWRSRRYLAVGWLWYVGTLVPVIGVIQVGTQAIADRYMYVPMIGLLIAVSLAASDLLSGAPRARSIGRAATTIVAGAVVLLLGALSWAQVRHWENSEALYTHALEVSTDEHYAYMLRFLYGGSLVDEGRLDEGLREIRASIRLNPRYPEAHRLLASTLAAAGDRAGAIEALETALRLEPGDAGTHERLGRLHLEAGRPDLAIPRLEEAARLAPDFVGARFNLSIALEQAGREDESLDVLRSLVEDRPDAHAAAERLAERLMERDEFAEANEILRRSRERRGAGHE